MVLNFALSVIVEMSGIAVVIENYLQGSLASPDIFALSCRWDQVYHKSLPLPTGAILPGFL